MAPSSDQNSSTQISTDPDLYHTPTPHSYPKLPATPSLFDQMSNPNDNDEQMEILEQIWRSLPQPLQCRDDELCAHPSAPTSSLSMEPDDPNSELANATRTSTAAQSFLQVPHSYTSVLDSTPLPTSGGASQGSIGKTKKCSSEPDQCDLPGTTSRSHFPIPRSK
nr:hypothetical protein CFP56_06230 [Quercus suber]